MIVENLKQIRSEIAPEVKLVAVSKTRSVAEISEAYQTGQRVFGENRVPELTEKHPVLPDDIEWHFIGHLQTNKVKYIAPFISCIHSVDSFKLLQEINKRAAREKRVINCLIQFHIAAESAKYGFTDVPPEFLKSKEFESLKNIRLCGVMGMATFTDDENQVRNEFRRLKSIFQELKNDFFADKPEFCEVSMGMSGDYKIAIEEGSTMVRIGSDIFGPRL